MSFMDIPCRIQMGSIPWSLAFLRSFRKVRLRRNRLLQWWSMVEDQTRHVLRLLISINAHRPVMSIDRWRALTSFTISGR